MNHRLNRMLRVFKCSETPCIVVAALAMIFVNSFLVLFLGSCLIQFLTIALVTSYRTAMENELSERCSLDAMGMSQWECQRELAAKVEPVEQWMASAIGLWFFFFFTLNILPSIIGGTFIEVVSGENPIWIDGQDGLIKGVILGFYFVGLIMNLVSIYQLSRYFEKRN